MNFVNLMLNFILFYFGFQVAGGDLDIGGESASVSTAVNGNRDEESNFVSKNQHPVVNWNEVGLKILTNFY